MVDVAQLTLDAVPGISGVATREPEQNRSIYKLFFPAQKLANDVVNNI